MSLKTHVHWPQIRDWAQRFFTTLSKRNTGKVIQGAVAAVLLCLATVPLLCQEAAVGHRLRLPLILCCEISSPICTWCCCVLFLIVWHYVATQAGTNPVYNLMPDVLSALSKDQGLDRAGFEEIMKVGVA